MSSSVGIPHRLSRKGMAVDALFMGHKTKWLPAEVRDVDDDGRRILVRFAGDDEIDTDFDEWIDVDGVRVAPRASKALFPYNTPMHSGGNSRSVLDVESGIPAAATRAAKIVATSAAPRRSPLQPLSRNLGNSTSVLRSATTTPARKQKSRLAIVSATASAVPSVLSVDGNEFLDTPTAGSPGALSLEDLMLGMTSETPTAEEKDEAAELDRLLASAVPSPSVSSSSSAMDTSSDGAEIVSSLSAPAGIKTAKPPRTLRWKPALASSPDSSGVESEILSPAVARNSSSSSSNVVTATTATTSTTSTPSRRTGSTLSTSLRFGVTPRTARLQTEAYVDEAMSECRTEIREKVEHVNDRVDSGLAAIRDIKREVLAVVEERAAAIEASTLSLRTSHASMPPHIDVEQLREEMTRSITAQVLANIEELHAAHAHSKAAAARHLPAKTPMPSMASLYESLESASVSEACAGSGADVDTSVSAGADASAGFGRAVNVRAPHLSATNACPPGSPLYHAVTVEVARAIQDSPVLLRIPPHMMHHRSARTDTDVSGDAEDFSRHGRSRLGQAFAAAVSEVEIESEGAGAGEAETVAAAATAAPTPTPTPTPTAAAAPEGSIILAALFAVLAIGAMLSGAFGGLGSSGGAMESVGTVASTTATHSAAYATRSAAAHGGDAARRASTSTASSTSASAAGGSVSTTGEYSGDAAAVAAALRLGHFAVLPSDASGAFNIESGNTDVHIWMSADINTMADWIGVELRDASSGAWLHSASFKTAQRLWTLPSDVLASMHSKSSHTTLSSLKIKLTVIGRGRKIGKTSSTVELPPHAEGGLALHLVVGE